MKKYLAVFAHPDDAEIRMAGILLKLARAGHEIKILSLTNGNAGHYSMKPEALAERRAKEARAAGDLAGISDYVIWDVPDGHLEVNLAMRERLMKEIRSFKPDVVFTFRAWDYHPDHRATAQLVQDIAYMVTVPSYCPDYPVPEQAPVILFVSDNFKSPCPFRADVVVDIDDVVEDKAQMMACHESQFFEWLAFDRGLLDQVPETKDARIEWMKGIWLKNSRDEAIRYRELLLKRYGPKAEKTRFAESIELSEYGRQPEPEELNDLLPL